MNTKALFLDLDGTLLNDAKEITPGNRAAISQALEAGHKVIITTGRPLPSAVWQAESLGMTKPGCYVIAYNGGVIYDMGARKTIFQRTIPLDLVQKAFAGANRRGIHIQTYDEQYVLVEPRCDDAHLSLYCEKTNMKFRVIASVEALEQEPSKLLAVDFDHPAPLEEYRRWLSGWAENKLDSFFSCGQLLEIVPHGLNKGTALAETAELLGILPENTVAAGDAANDLPMLRAAHVGVGMCNGTDEVKAAADYITLRDNNHDAIEEVIENLILLDHRG